MSIQIPLRHEQGSIDVPISDLPDDSSDIIFILKGEQPPLTTWLQVALAYHSQSKFHPFINILETIISSELYEMYQHELEDRAKAYNMLIGHYLNMALKSSSEEERNEFFNMANQHATDATSGINPTTYAMNYAAKGVLHLYEKKFDRAILNFDAALHTDEKNICALLGRAAVHYHQKEYQQALQIYSKVLTIQPNCPANIRLGMGLCYYKLNNYKKARLCFERVLQLEQNADALVALAILDLNSTKEDHVISAMNHLRKAYQIDPTQPMVLNHLANHFFYKSDLEKVFVLSKSAFQHTAEAEIKGDSCYQMARAFHYQGEYDKAYQLYNQMVTSFSHDSPLGNFGLGQLNLQRDEVDKAIANFERVSHKQPDNFETQKVLGSLYARKGDNDKALQYLKNAHALVKKDEEILIAIGQLSISNPKVALEAFHEAITIMKERNVAIPYQLLNNVGALELQLGKHDGIHNLMLALQASGSHLSKFESEHISIIMNIARFYETSQSEKAHEMYIKLVKSHPSLLEAYLRLAYIAFDKGNLSEAIGWCHLAKDISPKDSTPWFTSGLFYLKNRDWGKAQEAFEYILGSIDKRDTLTTLGMGNIYFSFVRPEMKEREEKYLKYASDNFEVILNRDPDNIVAAVGLGAIVAEQGYLEAAKEIFVKCREVSDDYPEIYINLGHVSLCLKEYHQAIKMYENCLKKFYNDSNIDLMMYLARVYFEMEEFDKCKLHLEKGLKIDPTNQMLWYNMAIVQHDICVKILKEKKKNVGQAQLAFDSVTSSRAIHKNLISQGGPLAAKSKNPLEFSKETSKVARQFLDDSILKAKYEEENLLKQVAKHEEQEKEKIRLEQEAAEKKRLEQEAKVKKALEEQRRFLQIQKEWKERDNKPFDEDEEGGGDDKKTRKRKTKKEPTESRKKKKKEKQESVKNQEESEDEVEFNENEFEEEAETSQVTEKVELTVEEPQMETNSGSIDDIVDEE